mmetsp:Transcript_128911/g.358923  ORF Transcript_128911/g.358923 Transcript_128911/m.358923 type:complete len:268 (+) Transcript_128911:100-903(+)
MGHNAGPGLCSGTEEACTAPLTSPNSELLLLPVPPPTWPCCRAPAAAVQLRAAAVPAGMQVDLFLLGQLAQGDAADLRPLQRQRLAASVTRPPPPAAIHSQASEGVIRWELAVPCPFQEAAPWLCPCPWPQPAAAAARAPGASPPQRRRLHPLRPGGSRPAPQMPPPQPQHPCHSLLPRPCPSLAGPWSCPCLQEVRLRPCQLVPARLRWLPKALLELQPPPRPPVLHHRRPGLRVPARPCPSPPALLCPCPCLVGQPYPCRLPAAR